MTESYKEWCSGKSHVEVIAEVQRAIRALLQDPLLNDLSPTVTPEEINSKLALAQGRALSLWLRVYDDHNIREKLFQLLHSFTTFFPLALVVLQGCTVQSLMQAVERNVMRRVKPSTVISW